MQTCCHISFSSNQHLQKGFNAFHPPGKGLFHTLHSGYGSRHTNSMTVDIPVLSNFKMCPGDNVEVT